MAATVPIPTIRLATANANAILNKFTTAPLVTQRVLTGYAFLVARHRPEVPAGGKRRNRRWEPAPCNKGKNSRLLCRAPRSKMRIDRGPQRPGERHLVLRHGEQLLVLGVGEVAQLDQGGRDIRRGQDREARLAVAARQEPNSRFPESPDDGFRKTP